MESVMIRIEEIRRVACPKRSHWQPRASGKIGLGQFIPCEPNRCGLFDFFRGHHNRVAINPRVSNLKSLEPVPMTSK